MHSFYSCARSNRVSSEPPPGFRRRDATAAEEKKADAAFGRACCFSCCPPRSRRVRNENSGGQTGRLIARVFAVKMFSERTSYPILFYLLASDEILYSMRAYMRGTYKWLESLGCLHQIL